MRLRALTTLLILLGLAASACSATAGTPAGAAPTAAGGAGGGGGGGGVATPTPATGGGGGGGGAAVVPDPCTLLTADEIKAQFGVEVATTGPSGAGAGAASPQCTWQATAINQPLAGVDLTIEKLDPGFFDYSRNAATNHVDVAGLGDGAFFAAPSSPYTLYIKKGDWQITLYVAGGGLGDEPDQAEKKVVTLANAVLGRL